MSLKVLRLPNGRRIASDQIQHVNVYPGRSISTDCIYLEIYDTAGLVYAGLVDLDRVVLIEGVIETRQRAQSRHQRPARVARGTRGADR